MGRPRPIPSRSRAAPVAVLLAALLLPAAAPPAAAEPDAALRARREANPPNQLARRQALGREAARRDAERRGDLPPFGRRGRGAPLLAGAGTAIPGLGRSPLPGAERPRAGSFDDLPGWREDALADAVPAVLASCRAFGAMTPGRPLGGGDPTAPGGTPESWRGACAELSRAWAAVPPLSAAGRGGRLGQARLRDLRRQRDALARDAFEANFVPALAGEGLLTAYYEPILRGALAPGAPFLTPLYRRPPELVALDAPGQLRPSYGRLADGGRLEPLPDRAAIQNGAFAGRDLELAWVEDPAEAFFLQIQGSGRVVLPDGRTLRVGYAGQNGHPYRAVGRSLIERGAIPENGLSMAAIRAWMAGAGPVQAAALMAENPSYVFFQLNGGLRDDQGPPGAMGIPLTPERSAAVDPAAVPLGAPVFISTVGGGPGAVRRLLAAQDTGGAIRGPGRADLFRGWGPEAGARAGNVRNPIRMWVLLPRQVPRLATRE